MARSCNTASWADAKRVLLLPLLGVIAVLVAPVLSVPADPTVPPASSPASTEHVAKPDMQAKSSNESDPQDVAAFFPQIKGNLSKVTWAHAVNNMSLLDEALKGDVMMLEADVIMGTLPNETSKAKEPIMGHPPAATSDLTLKEFLTRIVEYNTKHTDKRRGVKLDFKTIDVFEESLDFLKKTFPETPKFPVWLNADIMGGPVNATTTPVDAHRFLTKAKEHYPELMLSLGWTTRWGAGLDGQNQKNLQDQAKYTEKDVNAMIEAIKAAGVDQPITYAVRAAFVAHSADVLKSLIEKTSLKSGKATLTVWSSDPTDDIEIAKLRDSLKTLNVSKVYLDVGEDVAKKLGNSAMTAYASMTTLLMALGMLLLRGF